ncbi:hypothetical protein LZ198_39450 [Myxococcus sp. K15C18031901]|uniref:hypothetical protein n=1 Tax=Myxococcus dinghuensis TaxID=2906761 RepID=UPI0020A7968A|nr:hypothetical protein [Myxococcus dinghuensis]MCP3104959.1 hypothetical protein [Myxococcus dinghuensis]
MTDPNPARPPSFSSERAAGAGRKASVWSGVGLVVALVAGGSLYFRAGQSTRVRPSRDERAEVPPAAPGASEGPRDGAREPVRLRHKGKRVRSAIYTADPGTMGWTERAARATALGERQEAHAELDEALRRSAGFAPALFLRVCLALEEGDDARARAALEQLDGVVVVATPELDVLEQLRLLRGREGFSPLATFRDAWEQAGRPDFQTSGLLPGATPPQFDTSGDLWRWKAWREVGSDDVRRLVVLTLPAPTEEQALFLLQQVPRLQDPHDVLAVMDALKGEVLPESVRATARQTFRQKLEALMTEHPRSMQLRLQWLLGDTAVDAPLREADLVALEQAAALPVWRETSFQEHYVRTRGLLKDVKMPDLRATTWEVASRGLQERGTWLLRTRATGTRSALTPRQRQRLGRVTHAIGAAMARMPTQMERTTGLQLMVDGADALGDTSARAEAEARLRELDEALVQFRKTSLERWPLPMLAEELLARRLEDEPAFVLGFAAVAPAGTARVQP